MRSRRVLVALSVVAGCLLVVPGATPAAELEEPAVDRAVQVTADPKTGRGHAIPVLAQHPDDEQTLVLAETDAYSSRCSVHVTRDGGLTWSQANQPETPPDWPGCGFAITGALADLEFAPDGTLYYAFSAFQPNTYQQRIYLARSGDLGLTWDVTALPRIGPNPATREMGADAMPSIVVDRDAPQNVYVSWWSGNATWNMPESITGSSSSVWCRLVDNRVLARPWISASTDGGRTFGNPVDMAPGIGHCTTEPYLAQAADGAIYAVFGEATRTLEEGKAPPSHLYASLSRDGGKTFTVSTVHTQSNPADGRASTSTSDWLSGPSPGVNLENGDLYVAWESLGQGVPEILFSRSTDGGRTWSPAVKVNDGDPKRDWDFADMMATMDVAPNGRIDVVWYDYRNDPTFKEGDTRNGFQDVYYASSTDGGRTWSKNLRLNDRAIDRRFGPRRVGGIYGPLGLVSTDTATFVAWDDTRNGNEGTGDQDIYFTRVRYAPAAEVFGGETDTGTSPWVGGLLGAAIALAVAGLIFVIGTQMARRRREAGETSGTRPSKQPTTTGT